MVTKPACSTAHFAGITLLLLPALAAPSPSASDLIDAAVDRTKYSVRYDGSYRSIPYPDGDVPADVGVCTDVLIRSYRSIGVDLQRLVHEDMRSAFDKYPRDWGLSRPDTNIDHRRVPNLRRFFERHGESLPVSDNPMNYRPGDIVSWMLPNNRPHIGIVTKEMSADGERPLIVHNIGFGPKQDDMLFSFKITGHYRYLGPD